MELPFLQFNYCMQYSNKLENEMPFSSYSYKTKKYPSIAPFSILATNLSTHEYSSLNFTHKKKAEVP